MARYLVVANQTLGGGALGATIKARFMEGADIHVVVPATRRTHLGVTSTEVSANAEAQHRLSRELQRCERDGIHATGEVGASDPMQAIKSALREHHYTGLIISTLPASISQWLHLDLPHRAMREFQLPVEWVETRHDDETPSEVHLAVPASAFKAMHGPRFPARDLPPLAE